MWMLALLGVATALGLANRLTERTARVAIIPVVLLIVAFQALRYGLV